MATDSKLASNPVTKEIESRIKQIPEHLFEVFLEIHQPEGQEAPQILFKYPPDFSDDILKTASSFAYPCQIPPDEQSEHFAFVVLDGTGTLFRFGYCRRSNREASCLCLISFYPWFETFYNILNDLASIIISKAFDDYPQPRVLTEDADRFLSSLYHYKLLSNDERKETFEIQSQVKSYIYTRPDTRELPSTLTNRNFAVMFSRLGPEIMLNLFANLLFERRILFVSSKLFHLTACAYGCLHLIYPMHWQSLFLPILPASMTWTTQCTAPYIIGIHSSVFTTLNMEELGDAVIVNIDERKLDTQYEDLNRFPKFLIRSMKKAIQQSSQIAGDHLARVFLRAMAYAVGSYASGFVIRNEKLDFDRDLYLQQFVGSPMYSFMSSVAQTQMFEQFSRYRTYVQLQRETDIDEFDLEVKNYQQFQQSKKFKANKKISKLLEKYIKYGTISKTDTLSRKTLTLSKKRMSLFDSKDEKFKAAANPLVEQVQNRAGKFQTVITKAGQRMASEASIMKNSLTSLDLNEVIKRAQNSRMIESNPINGLPRSTSLHPSSSANDLNAHSIPYERFSIVDADSAPDLRLTNGDHDDSFTSDSSRSSTPEPLPSPTHPLINLEPQENPLLPSPIVLNVINKPTASPTVRSTPPVDWKIKQLQSELKLKVQTFDGKRIDPREDCDPPTEIRKLVKQFDPFDDETKSTKNADDLLLSSTSPVAPRLNNKSPSNIAERHPSLYETIPTNRVTAILQNIQSNYGTTTRMPLRTHQFTPGQIPSNNLIHFSPPSPPNLVGLTPRKCSTVPEDASLNFDPLAPSNNKPIFSDLPSRPSESNGSNLIDFN